MELCVRVARTPSCWETNETTRRNQTSLSPSAECKAIADAIPRIGDSPRARARARARNRITNRQFALAARETAEGYKGAAPNPRVAIQPKSVRDAPRASMPGSDRLRARAPLR